MLSPEFWDSADLQEEMRRQFDVCGSCRLCLNFCPAFPKLFDFIDEHDGEAHSLTNNETQEVNDHCYLCQLCFLRCPYVPPHEWEIDIPNVLRRGKAIKAKHEGVSLKTRLVGDIEYVGPLGHRTAPVTNWINNNSIVRFAMEKVIGVDRRAILPKFHAQTFEQWYKGYNSDCSGENGRVVLFYTCLVNYNAPEIGKALIKVLKRNGIQVVCSEQKDCGMPYVDMGNLDHAMRNMSYNIEHLYQWVKEGYQVIVPEPTCGMMIKKEYPRLIGTREAAVVAENTFDISEFLLNLDKKNKLDKNFVWSPASISYHMPCHLRHQQMGNKTLELLRLLPASEIHFVDRGCSGHDGTWGIKTENFDLSMKVGRRLFNDIDEFQDECIVTDCSLAGLQITQGTGRETIHPIQLIMKAYDL
ncbi:anaerobic glycerol-3-phosphate dehydrogenase subunit C [SAR202 cluster bacterium AD-802-E10_MRT_200m]|nr:anaerobic glycerol-3-phosphate dehydrogenase subunit C [SAR202 cluster bacterium AD-802-E10_MRT_200m]